LRSAGLFAVLHFGELNHPSRFTGGVQKDRGEPMMGPGMTATALYEQYMGFGDDPFIMPVDPNDAPVDFGGWAYAEQRCEGILAALSPAS
jgi:hypothetical protein